MRSLPVVSREVYGKFDACVHCGLCLPACPTYAVTGDEADSPRGRIHLMKAAVDGRVAIGTGAGEMVLEHLERCLVCRACEPACPSGVEFHVLMEAVRPQVAEKVLGKGRRMRSRFLQWVVGHVFPYAGRARAGMWAGRMAMRVGMGWVVPGVLREAMGAGALSRHVVESSSRKATGERRGCVILLRGCVGSVVSGGVNEACVRVLTANGVEVEVLEGEPCCGAMAAHANDPEGAKRFAMRMVEVLWGKLEEHRRDADATLFFVSPIAGCGAQLKALHHVLAGTGYEERARAVVGKMRDVTEFLAEVGVRPPEGRIERVVTYHDPCHLLNVQRVSEGPRYLLGLVPGLKVVALAESDMCCGAAGTYNLSQPAMAELIGRRKVENILATGAEEVVTANVGCAMQLEKELRRAGRGEIRVRHVVEVLAESYGEVVK